MWKHSLERIREMVRKEFLQLFRDPRMWAIVFVAPLLLGEGIRAVSGWAGRSPSSGKRLAFTSVRRVGPDIEITAEVR